MQFFCPCVSFSDELIAMRQLPPLAALRAYRPVWKEQSAWTLVGVLSTEATSNAHS